MGQPRTSERVIASMRRLADDAGLRAYFTDAYGMHRGHVSRVLRSLRDEEAVEPTVGFLEALIERAQRAEDDEGHAARVEELLSALVGGRSVRLADAGAVVALHATPAQVLDRAAAGAMPLACVIDQVRKAVADGRIDTTELRDIRQAAAALKAAVNLVEQTAEAATRAAGREPARRAGRR